MTSRAPSSTAAPTPPSPLSSVGVRRIPPTSLSVQRREGRRVASEILARVLDGRRAAVARHLDVSADAVEQWADPGDSAAVTLGDVLVMQRGEARAILVQALAAVTAPTAHVPLSVRGCVIAKETGEAVGALARPCPRTERLRELYEARDSIDDAIADLLASAADAL